MEPYARNRRATAWSETRRFWNVHQNWKHFAAPVTGCVIGLRQGFVLSAILTAAISAVVFYAVAWAGTFVINYIWLTPAALHREQAAAVDLARDESEVAKSEAKRLAERVAALERQRVKDSWAEPIAIPEPVLSSADQSMQGRARDDLRDLNFERRTALRLIYARPGQYMGAYIRQLQTLGFSDGESGIKYLMNSTVLVNSTSQRILSQSAHTCVSQLVEREMEQPNWAGI